MNNLTKRFAIFVVLGALLSSALLVGCGGKSDDDSGAANTATPKKEKDKDADG